MPEFLNFITHPLPEQGSSFAAQHDSLFYMTHIIVMFFFFSLNSALLYFIFRYRRTSINKETPDIRNNHKLEIVWALMTTILLMCIFSYGAKIFMVDYRTVPEDAISIKVTGKQWFWTFEHKGGATTSSANAENNELLIPAGKAVLLKLSAPADDVMHSFYIPAFRVKKDVIPNLYTYQYIQSDKVGKEYPIYCAEFCGKDHSLMNAKLKVVSQSDYDAYLDANRVRDDLTPLEMGQNLFQMRCAVCHKTGKDEGFGIGPNFWGVVGRTEQLADGSSVVVDSDYIKESLRSPSAKVVKGFQNVMTPFPEADLSGEAVDNLIEYLKSLKDD